MDEKKYIWKQPSIDEIIHCWTNQPPLKGIGWPIGK